MVHVLRSTVLEAPVEDVWALLRDFNSHAGWHPAIATSVIEEKAPPDAVGAVRAFSLQDGSALRERLIGLSDRERTLTYCIVEAPLPLLGYVATLEARPVTDGGGTFLRWQSRFRTPAGLEAEAADLVGRAIYEAGFSALRRHFASLRGRLQQRAPAPPTSAPVFPRSRPEQAEAPSATPLPGASAAEGMPSEAIVVERHGGPEVMRLRAVSVPPPGPGEVTMRHTAVGVNFIDVYCRRGSFTLLKPPGVPGMEAAGEVLDVGEGVHHLRRGDRVVYACEPVGAYARHRTMPARLVVKLPDDVEDEVAAGIALKGITADFLLHRVHAVTREETILVHAAAGGVGLLLCQWASALGARVIGVVSTSGKAEAARAAGAAETIVTSREGIASAVRDLTGGRGVDVAYDPIGGATFDETVASLALRGHLVSFGQASGPLGLRDLDALGSRSLTLSRPGFGHYAGTREEVERSLGRVFDALRRGVLTLRIGGRYPLAEAAEAHARLEGRDTIGPLLLIP